MPVCSAARSVVYARRPFPLIDPLVRSSPDLGAGELIEAGGQGRTGRRGSGEKMRRRNVLAFPTRFLIRSVYPVSRSRLVIVVVCGIPCRLAHRLVPPSRSVVSFPVCFFSFPPWGVSLVVSPYLVSLFASRRLAPLRLLPFPHSLRLVSVRHCHHRRRRSCLALLSPLSLSFSSPSLLLASYPHPSALPLRFPDAPYETTGAPDVPLIYSLGCFPTTIAMGNRWENELGKTAPSERTA